MASAFCYYGIVLMSTEILQFDSALCETNERGIKLDCRANCRVLGSDDYIALLWTTLAEFPGNYSDVTPAFSTKNQWEPHAVSISIKYVTA